jgi:hypothetical protein
LVAFCIQDVKIPREQEILFFTSLLQHFFARCCTIKNSFFSKYFGVVPKFMCVESSERMRNRCSDEIMSKFLPRALLRENHCLTCHAVQIELFREISRHKHAFTHYWCKLLVISARAARGTISYYIVPAVRALVSLHNCICQSRRHSRRKRG